MCLKVNKNLNFLDIVSRYDLTINITLYELMQPVRASGVQRAVLDGISGHRT